MIRLPFRLTAMAIPAALGLALAAASVSSSIAADPQAPYWGRGMGGSFGGPAMMGRGFGPGRGMGPAGGMGPSWYQAGAAWGDTPAGNVWPGAYRADADKDGVITVDEVKAFVESRHAARGFNDLKLGAVKEKGDDAIVAEIVDTDGDVVRTLIFPKKIDRAAFARADRPRFAQAYAMRGPRGGFDGRTGAWGRGMHGDYGRGMRAGYGPGTGYGYGPGMRAAHGPRAGAGVDAGRAVTVDDVKSIIERRLASWNNPHLKLGTVQEADGDTITADIVTQDGSLVESLKFDRKTGRPTVVR